MNARRPRLALGATIAAGAAAAVLAAPASASQSTLSLTLQGNAAQNQVATIAASGVNAEPTSESNLSGQYSLYIYAKHTSADSSCAPDQEQESSNYFNNVFNPAVAHLYAAPAIGLGETYGPGSFNIHVKQAFATSGRWLLCGYSVHFGSTVAADQMTVDVAPAGGGGPAIGTKPEYGKKPRISRKGRKLSCRRGSWTNASTYRYSWMVNGKTKKGARKSRLKVTRSLRGRTVKCRVTAYNGFGKKAATSRPYRVR